ncbi:PROPROTEIN CONVERTASE SUBTILISIN/KEXIN [Salix purpurea]|uniref:PROPROTEIN CONVERTASE SUBTILISIN/KEXIN n=1 Tax=Salix purpurea TaxID=77065 RepID=A0A9Q0WFE0_SALPP|nr:PROPROTEIN CONVERTASE SUBTILISIN/KEXIN [Salix purpurea]
MASLWSPGIFLVLVLALPLKTLPLVTLAETNVYIVYMGDKLHDEPELVQESHHELLADIVGRDIPGLVPSLVSWTQGQALYTGKNVDTFHPIVYGEDIAAEDSDEDRARSCDSGSLNATSARGKVILCFGSRSQRSNIIARRTVLDVKGVGLIFAQFPTKDVTLSLDIPCIQVDFAIGTYLLTYMESSRNPVVKFSFTKTVIGKQISPEVAFFSSRGPSSISATVLKPDIAAPGVNILASWSPAASPAIIDNEVRPLDFKIESGTSMSCPHISGVVALLKAAHPKWSPAAIKSALITTASIEDEYGQKTVAEGAPYKQADPFDYGGGHVDPDRAMYPGLVFDMGTSDYIRFLCALGYNSSAISLMTRTRTRCKKSANFLVNLNLPSITIPELKQNLTVSRTVTNVGPITSIYVARVLAPAGTQVTVEPSVLSFDSTRKEIKFKVTFCSLLRIQGRYSFGNLFWEDGFHVVRIPLIVRTVIDDFYAET